MIKVILFDIDNTLLDFDAYVKQTLKSGFEHFNLGKYQDWMFDKFTTINISLWKELEKGNLTFQDIKHTRFTKVFEGLGINFDGPTFENYFRENIWKSAILIKGSIEALTYLNDKGYILATASNGPYEQQIHRQTISGLIDFFKYQFISEEVGFSKPSIEFFNVLHERISKDMCVKPDEILIVGDSFTSDMKLGINSGMKTCFYNPKNIAIPEDFNIDFQIKDLSELVTIL